MLYTYKIKLQPTKLQAVLLNKHLGARRWVYNNLLAFRKQEYLTNSSSMSYGDMCRWIKERKDSDCWWLKEVNSQSLQQSAKDLDGAYSNFFKGLALFPRFQSRYGSQSFRVPASVRFVGNKFVIPKFSEGIKFFSDREITEAIKVCTITQSATGESFATLVVEKDIQPLPKTQRAVGIDKGIKQLAVCSDGMVVANPRSTYKWQWRIKLLSRRLSKKRKGSSNRLKAKRKLARIHAKIANTRKDHIHKATRKIVQRSDTIVIEDLNTKGMLRNRKLAKAISDASFGEIKRQLEYKSKWYGKHLVKIDRWFPSSRTCASCGWIHQNLKLRDRTFSCTQCAYKADRDWNASVNILKQGIVKLLRGGTSFEPVEYPLVDDQNLMGFLRSNGTVKQEPHLPFAVGGCQPQQIS